LEEGGGPVEGCEEGDMREVEEGKEEGEEDEGEEEER